MSDRPRYTLTVEALPLDGWPAPPRRLAGLLKSMLRGHGFRCLAVEEVRTEAPAEAAEDQGEQQQP